MSGRNAKRLRRAAKAAAPSVRPAASGQGPAGSTLAGGDQGEPQATSRPPAGPLMTLPGARNLSKSAGRNPVWLLEQIHRRPDLFAGFVDELAAIRTNWGRRRLGNYGLALLCFVNSGSVDIVDWHDDHKHDALLWGLCGFERIPSYRTLARRFNELARHNLVFRRAAARLIANARRHVPEIGRDTWLDCTEEETHAFLHYYGPNLNGLTPQEAEEAMAKARHERRVKRLSADDARIERDAFLGEEDDTIRQAGAQFDGPPGLLDPSSLVAGEVAEARIEEERLPSGRTRRWMYLLLGAKGKRTIAGPRGGNWYRILDPTAGFRAYAGGEKAWLGFYNLKWIDHTVGAPLLVIVGSASVNEFKLWLASLELAIEHLGFAPGSVTADSGFSFPEVHEAHTRRAIKSIIKLRNSGRTPSQDDNEIMDDDGIVTCGACGNECFRDGFYAEPHPYTEWTCSVGAAEGCFQRKQVACSTEWRRLGPLEMTSLEYQELLAAHSHRESLHGTWRKDYGVGADDLGLRSKKPGLAWRQLLADVALLVEWIRLHEHNGWWGSAREARRGRKDLERSWIGHGRYRCENLEADRRERRLDLPRGPQGRARYWGRVGAPPPAVASS